MKESDWAQLPDDVAIEVLLRLNKCDRASFASTCRSCRTKGSSLFLWPSLDLRLYKFDSATAFSIASRCSNLQKLQVKGDNVSNAIINLQAINLREITVSESKNIGVCLSSIAGRHPHLESLELSSDGKLREVSSDEIQVMALCCPNLRKLRLSYVNAIMEDAIDALSIHCRKLSEIGFTECFKINEVVLGKFSSLRFLSFAGTSNINWNLVCEHWPKLPILIGLDLSRTNVNFEVISRLLSSSSILKVLCALQCPKLVIQKYENNKKCAKLLANYSDVCHWFCIVIPNNDRSHHTIKDKDKDEITTWLENITSQVLVYEVSQTNSTLASIFRIKNFGPLVLHLMLSPQKDVQEKIAKVLKKSKFTMFGNEAVVTQFCDKGLCFLLDLAKSQHEVLQLEAIKAILNFCRYPSAWKSVENRGGVSIFMNLLRSSIRPVAEEIALGLSVLATERKNEDAIFEAGFIVALLVIITGRFKIGELVLKKVVRSLAHLALDKKCGRKVARAGGLQTLVKMALESNNCELLKQVVRAIHSLFVDQGSDKDPLVTAELHNTVKIVIHLTSSKHFNVREEAVNAIFELCEYKELTDLSPAQVVKLLIAESVYEGIERKVSSALWKLSVSKEYGIAIGQQAGDAFLIRLTDLNDAIVQMNAVGALGNVFFNKCIDSRIERCVVSTLNRVCATPYADSVRFTAALALAYIYYERSDDRKLLGRSSRQKLRRTGVQHEAREMALNQIKVFIFSRCDPEKFSAAASASSPLPDLLNIAETLYIPDANCTCYSDLMIERLLVMLRDRSFVFAAIAAFALFQFTSRGGKRALLQEARVVDTIHEKAAFKSSHDIVKVLCKLVLIH